MRFIAHLLIQSLCLLTIVFADPLDGYWQQKVDYDMEITLVDSIKQLTGFTTIKYKNNSPDSLDRIYLHLYPNAFQVESVKYREYVGFSGRASRAKYFKEKLDGFTSKIEVHDFNVAKKGNPVLKDWSIDDTILEAHLNKKLAPGELMRIDLSWTHHVGEMVERAGLFKGQYNMAQWYPKVAVYDEEGWHADVFHAEGEFYGEFGDFTVKFDLPEEFIIGASGIVTHGDPGWESVTVDTSIDYDIWLETFDSLRVTPDSSARRHVTFFAENVHDFAWVASKDFLYEGGVSGDGETDVHVLYDKGRGKKWTKDVLARSIRAIDWLEEKFGNYPYPQVTTTDRVKNGGMEYPMLVMNGRESEGLIVHEFGHIYFYGILANNELDEAWLDEGFTTTQTTAYLMERYGDHGYELSLYPKRQKFPQSYWPLGNDLHSDQWRVINFMRSGHDENISRPSYWFNNGSAYDRNAYTKPALMLNELKYVLGEDTYYKALQHYYNKWKLKHVNELRFIESVEEYTGQELDWFFDAWLHTTRQLDYGISSFDTKKESDGMWTVNLGIESVGTRYLPMLVETTFDDGTTDRRWWKNHLWRFDDVFTYKVDKKPVKVTLDPDVQTVDLDFRNNTTKMKKKVLFDWPGMWYNPRDEYVIKWKPNFYYHESTTGFAPGATVSIGYGPYSEHTFRGNYGLESNELLWSYYGWCSPVHFFPRTSFSYWAYDRPGVQEYGGQVSKDWNKVYGRTPTHTFTGGFYIQPNYDSTRAQSLGYSTDGDIAVGYVSWETNFGPVDFWANTATSLGSLSSWNFTRFTIEGDVSVSKGPIHFKERVIAGKILASETGVPGQEGYNVEGNSSNDLIRKDYLADQLYGLEMNGETLFGHYHLAGEGNIRGFTGTGERGAEALIASSSEAYYPKRFGNTTLSMVAFFDGGVFWDRFNQTTNSLQTSYISRTLINGGLGVRLRTKIFEKEYYLRVDVPLFIQKDGEPFDDGHQWIFSFQRSL